MEKTFDIVAIKGEIDAGRLDVPGFVKMIDQKMETLNKDIEDAKEFVQTARKTGGDICGLGSKKRFTALADALTRTNETISETHDLIRGVIGLILCSATFASRLIQSSAELFGGQMKDANGRIVKVSAQTKEFIRSVVEIAKGVMTTQTELRKDITEAKGALNTMVKSQVDQMLANIREMECSYAQKTNDILEETRKIAKQQDLAIDANKDAIQKGDAKNAEQDRLLKRQAEKDDEHDRLIAENLVAIRKNRDEIERLVQEAKNVARSIASTAESVEKNFADDRERDKNIEELKKRVDVYSFKKVSWLNIVANVIAAVALLVAVLK